MSFDLQQQDRQITCPFCWESLDILIDPSAGSQRYTEDCQVCCHPIGITVTELIDGSLTIETEAE